jgi:hypothetical protein
MEQNTDTDTSLLNKTQDELTVKDSLKLQLYGVVAVGTIYAVAVAGVVGVKTFADWRDRKAAEKILHVVDTTATDKE